MKRYISLFFVLCAMMLAGMDLSAQVNAPTVQARYLTFTGTTISSVNLSWYNGNGDGRIVVVKADDNNWDEEDAAISVWSSAPNDWNGGYNEIIPVGNGYIVDVVEGTNRTSTVSSLPNSGTTYYFKVYEFNKVGSVYDFNVTDGTAMNPRSKATLPGFYGMFTATVSDDNGTANADGQWAKLSWASTIGDVAEWDLSIYNNSNAVVSGYEELDLGTLDAGTPENFLAYIGNAGTYYAKVRSRLSNQLGAWISSTNFTINAPTNAPAFDVTTPFTFAANEGYVTVTFNREVTSISTGAAADLAASDFGINFTQGTGTASGASVWKVEKVSATQYKVYVRFTGRANGNEDIVIRPADNYSIFGRNGVAMNANNGGTQLSNSIDCLAATVVNTTTTFAYVKISEAVEDASTVNGHTLQLKDNTDYSENVSVAKNLTITDQNTLANARFAGTFTFTGALSSSPFTIDGITMSSVGAATSCVIANQGVLYVRNNTINYDDGDKAINMNGGSYGLLYIGRQNDGVTPAANTFNRSGNTSSANAIYIKNGSAFGAGVAICNNAFNAETGASHATDKIIYLNLDNSTAATAQDFYFDANAFDADQSGEAFYFTKDAGAQRIINQIFIRDNTFSNTGKSIAFNTAVDLTGHLTVIDLGGHNDATGNTNSNGMSITTKYVYSRSTLDESRWLYPGIAVLDLNDEVALLAGTAVEYNTVAAAIAASDDDGTQTVFLGEGTYTEAIVLDEAVNLMGKGPYTETGTVCTNVITVSGVATYATTVSDIIFDTQNTNSIVIDACPANSTININDISVDYQAGDVAINVTAPTVAGTISIAKGNGSNNFSKSFALDGGDAAGTAIAFADNQITGNVTISENNFQFNSSEVDKGIYFSTTNSTGVSNGRITITGNQFQGAEAYVVDDPATTDFDETDGFNAKGDAIVFEDAVNNAFSMSGATINIYNQNNFSQVGYGIKIAENATYAGAIHTTLPSFIDVWDATAANGLEDNENFIAEVLYGVAWYNGAGDNTLGFLYPSLQYAETQDLHELLKIGAGTYKEDVTFSAGTNLTEVLGVGTCELNSTNRVTIEKDYAFSGTFAATLITVGDDDVNTTEGNIDDAMDVAKANSTISIAADAVIGGGTVDKDVTINEVAAGGTIDGTLTIAKGGVDVTNLTLTGNPAIRVAMTDKNDGSIAITGNTFTIPAGTSTTVYADMAKAVVIEAGNATSASAAPIATNGFPVNFTGNTFEGMDGALADSRIAIAITNTNANQTFATFSGVNVYNANIFNNDGFSFYQTGLNNVCTVLSSVDIDANSDNTYSANLLTNHIKGFYYSLPLADATDLYLDCAAPADFTVGTVVATTYADPIYTDNTGTAVDYFNAANTHLKVVVPMADDASLVNGTVQVQITKNDGSLNWTNVDNSGLSTIATANTNKIMYLELADLTATGEFAENATPVLIRAIITDMATNPKTGTQSADDIKVDLTVPAEPTNNITTPLTDGQRINSLSQIAGSYSDASGVPAGNIKVSLANTSANPDVYWNGTDWTNTTEQLNVATRNTGAGTYVLNVPLTNLVAETNFTAKAYIKDNAGNEGNFTRTFIIDPVPPVLTTATVINDNTIDLTFNESLDEDWTNVPATVEGQGLASFYSIAGTANEVAFDNGDLTFVSATRQADPKVVRLVYGGTPFANMIQCETITVTVNSIKDEAGNSVLTNADPAENTAIYTEPDVTAPFVTKVERYDIPAGATADNNYLTNAPTVKYLVTFSEDVKGVTTGSFEFTNAEAANAECTSVASVDATSADNEWIITVTPEVDVVDGGHLGIAVKAAGSGITDLACGHADNAFAQGVEPINPNHTYRVDRKQPVIVNANPDFLFTTPSSVATTYWNGGNKNITWTPARITDGSGLAAVNPIELEYSLDNGTTWIPVIAGTVNDGTHEWAVPSDVNVSDARIQLTATDAAGNEIGDISNTFVIDNTKPEVTEITITPNNAPTGGYKVNNTTASVTIVAKFNSAMKNTVAPTLTLSTGLDNILNDEVPTSANWSTTTLTNDTYTWVLAVNGAGLNDMNQSITITDAQDLATNTNKADATSHILSGIKVDQILPTLSAVKMASNNATTPGTGDNAGFAKIGNTVTLSFTSSEAIGTPTVTIATRPATEAGATTTWTATYVMTENEATGVIPFTANYTDLAGNAGVQVVALSTPANNITFDMTAPVFTLDAPATNAYVNGTQAVTISAVTETNMYATEARIGTTANWGLFVTGGLISSLNGYNANNNGDITINVRHTDKAGNATIQSVTVHQDMTAPEVTVTRVAPTVGDAAGFYTNQNAVQFELEFTEPLLNFDFSDITVNANGVTFDALEAGDLTGPVDDVYTLTVTNIAQSAPGVNGTVTITVNKAAFTDRAANTMAANVGPSSAFTIDQTKPTFSSVEVNCTNTPVNGYTTNRAIRMTFSEAVYSTANASGDLAATSGTATDFLVTKTSGNAAATINAWNLIAGTGEAGDNTADVSLSWTGTITGSEEIIVNFKQNQVFDRAGNAALGIGDGAIVSDTKDGTNNWNNTNAILAITTHPVNAAVCAATSPLFTASANGDAGTTYGWEVSTNGTTWTLIDPANNTDEYTFNVDGSELTVNNVIAGMSGRQFRFIAANVCNSQGIPSNPATLTVNPNTSITTQPIAATTCYGDVDEEFTVVAGGHPPVTYTWEYSATGNNPTAAQGTNGWSTVADGTPANADYTGANTATLSVNNQSVETLIPFGTYYYRVVVSSGCGADVISEHKALTIHALPTANLVVDVQDADEIVCTGTGTNITIANSQINVKYQLRNNTNDALVGGEVNGDGNTINLPTGNLTATTTFNVLATTITTGCLTELLQTATVTVEPTAVAGSLAKTPNAASICEGTNVSALLTAGTGGNGTDELEVRTHNGTEWSNWAAYTSANAITTTGKTQVEVRTRRAATACTPSAYTTVNWTVEATPVAGTLTRVPNNNVCVGTSVSATFAGGTGGNGTNEIEVRTNDGTAWSAWTGYVSGNAIVTTGKTGVEVRTRRMASVCTPSAYNTVSWTINPLPTQFAVTGGGAYCTGGAGVAVSLNGSENGVNYQLVRNGNVNVGGVVAGTGAALNFGNQTTAGAYTVVATNSVTSCVNNMTGSATVSIDPAITVQNVFVNSVCEGNIQIFLQGTENNVLYEVLKGGNPLSPVVTQLGTNNGMFINISNATAGAYTVRASRATCTNVAMNGTVTVNAPPTANAGNDETTCGTNAKVFAAGAAVTNAASFAWTITAGDPAGVLTNETTLTPTYTPVVADYGKTLTFTLTAEANGTCEDATDTKTLTIYPPTPAAPSIAATGNVTTFCGTANTTLTATTAGATSYTWWKDGNVVVGNTTATLIVSNLAASATYTAKATNSCGTSETAGTITLIVNEIPAAPTAGDLTVAYNGAVRTASATPASGATISWFTTENGNVPSAAPSATDAGTYTAWAASLKDGCPSATRTLVTLQINKVNLTVTAQGKSKCEGANDPALTYAITGFVAGDDESDITGTPSLTRAAGTTPGNYTITPTIGTLEADNYSFVMATGTLTINALPTTPTITGNGTVAQGVSLTLTAEAGYSSYTWNVDGGNITDGTGTNEIIVNWGADGNKNVTVTVTNASGCQATSAVKVVSVAEACVAASITNQPQSQTVCAGTNTSFTVTANGTGLTYTWYKVGTPNTVVGGNSATLSIINPQAGDAGFYFVVIDNECTANPGVQSDNVQLTVTTPVLPTVSIVSSDPDNTICPGNEVTFTATAGNFGGGTVAYQWKVAGVNAGANQNTFATTTLADNDAVTCTITITGGCVTTASVTSIGITTAVNALTAVTNPGNTTVGVGANATFTVTGTNVSSYQWQVNTGSGWTNVANVAPYSGATTNTLTITAATAEMSGNTYQVVTTGQCSNPTSAPATLTVSLQAPTTQASNINWTSAAFNSLGLSWTNGNGTGRLLVGKAGASSIPTLELPVDNTLYTSGANTNYANATIYAGAGIGTTTGIGTRALVAGNVNAVTIDGLTANTRYCFRLFEYNHSGSNIIYNKSLLTNTSRSRYTPLKDGIIDRDQLGEGSIMTLSPIHPNPAKDKVALNFDMKENAAVKISLFNLQGIEVFKLDAQYYSVGQHTIEVPLTDLPSGAYTFVIGSGDEVIVESIVVVK